MGNTWYQLIWPLQIGIIPNDYDPDQFIFNDIFGANINQLYTSNIITLTGMTPWVSTSVIITGYISALYKNGILVWATTTWGNGDQFYLAMTGANTYWTLRTWTMTVGVTSGTWWITTNIPVSIAGPANLNIGQIQPTYMPQAVVKAFSGTNDHFQVVDPAGVDTWYYTTINISDLNAAWGESISNMNISVKTLNGILTLGWSTNTNVQTAITWSYQTWWNNTLTFIKRDTWANGWLTGTYWSDIVLQLTVPAAQSIWNYSGVIMYTLY